MPITLDTPDKLEYVFHPVRSGIFNFKVRSPKDAHLALTTGPAESDPMIEVFIGGWENSKSVIRKNKTQPEKAETPTNGILSAGEFRGFWIRWTDGIITVGREGEVAAFLIWEDPQPFPVNFVGVCTGWGASGSWIIQDDNPYGNVSAQLQGGAGGAACWVPSSGGQVPVSAVAGGQDGETLYVARARHEGALIPGKLVPSHGVTYIAWGGGEHGKAEYDVLCGCSTMWVPVQGDAIPPQAQPAGETEGGEPLFVGRVNHEGSLTIGKVQPSHGTCYISYGGQELAFQNYEVLLITS